jgi:C-terminal processing protease CtpA/Prc
LTVALFEGKPFVVVVKADSEPAGLGVKPGSEVLEVDGLPVKDKIEQLRLRLRACSSERAFLREACRYLLAGERDTKVKVKLRVPDGHAQTFALRRTGGESDPPSPPCAFDLKPGRFVQFGHHPSGLGYIRITSFDSHEEVAPEFDQALEALRTAPGLILDIRDNPGGFGQPQIVGRLLQGPALCSISFVKNGPRHGDLKRHEDILEPAGPWQYGGPIALLVNDGTGSAADLFACELRSAKRVVTVGSTTHGNLSGVAAYAVLPCGLIVRISNGYICDATGKPIEGVGNEPDVPVSPSIGDILAGRDPVLERAAALLGGKLTGMGVTPGKQ